MREMGSIRRFNRFYSSILGRIDQKIYHDPYPLTEVRVLQEIDFENGKTASEIGDKLGIDRGYMSRIIKKFDSAGLIEKKQLSGDKRHFALFITKKGKEEIEKLVATADDALVEMTKNLSLEEFLELVAAMQTIEKLFSKEDVN